MSRWLKYAAAVLVGIPLLLVVYGALIEPRLILDVERLETRLPDLAPQDADTTVAMFSDLQVGMWLANTNMVERVVAEALEAEPDVVLLGGDFVYSADPDVGTQIDAALALLAPLIESGIPTYAVLGNHDYTAGAADALRAALEDHGIQVLQNEWARLPAPDDADGGDLHVVGIGATRPGFADVDQALDGLPDDAPRIVLMHNPTSFPDLPAGSAPLALAGHTHCGQIALPGMPRWSYLRLTEEEALVADGFAPTGYGEEGNQLFVNCGIGFSLVPIRINAAPQLVIVELTAD